MATLDLTDDNFEAELEKASFAVVDFHAGWCGPCIMFKPKFKRISSDYPHVTFFLLDGEKNPTSRKTVEIDNLPYFGVYKDGVLVEGKSLSTEEAFRSFIEGHFGKEASA